MMNSVERIQHYASGGISKETQISASDRIDPPANWPSQGKLEFSNLVMGYRDGPDVLKNLTFTVNAGEKVGVVGRTGMMAV